jgi:predicted Co/Zn/Cd cation transporter (cation efflux family)
MDFWRRENYQKLFSFSIVLTTIGIVLSIIEFLTENSHLIVFSGLFLIGLLLLFKSKFY